MTTHICCCISIQRCYVGWLVIYVESIIFLRIIICKFGYSIEPNRWGFLVCRIRRSTARYRCAHNCNDILVLDAFRTPLLAKTLVIIFGICLYWSATGTQVHKYNRGTAYFVTVLHDHTNRTPKLLCWPPLDVKG